MSLKLQNELTCNPANSFSLRKMMCLKLGPEPGRPRQLGTGRAGTAEHRPSRPRGPDAAGEDEFTTDFLDRIDQFSLLCVWPSR